MGSHSIRAYRPYVHLLELLLSKSDHASLRAALDGQPTEVLRGQVPLTEIRRLGAFFTGSVLAARLISPIASRIRSCTPIHDGACGVGNLLVACAEFLPLAHDLESTLALWGRCLSGYDIDQEFVRAARLRLALKAMQRGLWHPERLLMTDDALPGIRCLDSLEDSVGAERPRILVLNPPYTLMEAPDSCQWARGRVSAAAVFLSHFLESESAGSQIAAILPDVLRSGSHYERWRAHVSAKARIDSAEVVGLFDKFADVDVFILRLTVGAQPQLVGTVWWERREISHHKVRDFFEAHVGSVVPHRAPKNGSWYPYLRARNLPAWGSVIPGKPFRRFSGTVYTPPFVVVRRTSRPGDGHRVVGTVIRGTRPVAVENHLIVLKPLSGLVKDCKGLLRLLKRREVSEWLDGRIRCRHLTVPAVNEIPWIAKE